MRPPNHAVALSVNVVGPVVLNVNVAPVDRYRGGAKPAETVVFAAICHTQTGVTAPFDGAEVVLCNIKYPDVAPVLHCTKSTDPGTVRNTSDDALAADGATGGVPTSNELIF